MKAVISKCGSYRYMLSRSGDAPATRGPAVFIMLNPSTADHMKDDPTIRRCRAFARSWDCDGLIVANLYALRSPRPKDLWTHGDPVGPENDRWLKRVVAGAAEVVCAWGANARHDRVQHVTAMLQRAGVRLTCLGTTKAGAPRHPLYVRGDQQLVAWTMTAKAK